MAAAPATSACLSMLHLSRCPVGPAEYTSSQQCSCPCQSDFAVKALVQLLRSSDLGWITAWRCGSAETEMGAWPVLQASRLAGRRAGRGVRERRTDEAEECMVALCNQSRDALLGGTTS
jgi:hypothetical protein